MNRKDFQLPDYSGNPLGKLADEPVEQQIICSLCAYPANFNEVDDILTSECFFNPKNRILFDTIKDRILAGEKVDMPSLGMALVLDKKGELSSYYLNLMMTNQPESWLRDKVAYLATLNLRRNMYLNAEYLREGASDPSRDIDEVIEESQRRIRDAYSLPDDKIENGEVLLQQLEEHILDNYLRDPGELYGSPTGFEDIDNGGGLCPGDLIVIGAETSQGKTSFATALTISAIKHGHGVAFYSMEMSARQVMSRIVSMQSGLSSSHLLFGRVEAQDIYLMKDSVKSINLKLLHFDSKSKASLDSILSSIRRLVLKEGIKGAVVDYLQLINTADSRISREQATAQCARALKNLAKELGIWIIVISQMSRAANSSGMPNMARLRDSGQIEEAADNIYLIYRPGEKGSYPEPYKDITTKDTALVMIAKGRNTGTGSFICGFDSTRTLFYPLNGANPRFAQPPMPRFNINNDF